MTRMPFSSKGFMYSLQITLVAVMVLVTVV